MSFIVLFIDGRDNATDAVTSFFSLEVTSVFLLNTTSTTVLSASSMYSLAFQNRMQELPTMHFAPAPTLPIPRHANVLRTKPPLVSTSSPE